MKIKLLKDILDGNNLKVAVRRNKAWTPPKLVNGEIVQSKEREYIRIPFVVGAEIEASDATATKWIEAGLAEEIKVKAP